MYIYKSIQKLGLHALRHNTGTAAFCVTSIHRELYGEAGVGGEESRTVARFVSYIPSMLKTRRHCMFLKVVVGGWLLEMAPSLLKLLFVIAELRTARINNW